MWYFSVHVEHPFYHPSFFIILLDWSFYNSKNFIPNGLTNPFGRRNIHSCPIYPIKLIVKIAPKGSHLYCSSCRNLPPGSISPFLGPALSRNPISALVSVFVPAFTPVPAPAPALIATNDLFKQFMKAYLKTNQGLR